MYRHFIALIAMYLHDLSAAFMYAAFAGVLIATIQYSDTATSLKAFVLYAISIPLGIFAFTIVVAATEAMTKSGLSRLARS